MSIGKKVEDFRRRKGFSQDRLAQESKLSLRTIQRLESNMANPSGYTLIAIAKILEIDVSELQTEITKEKTENDIYDLLNRINVYGLLGIVLPFGNVIFPYLFWRKYKDLPEINSYGRRIISFQIFWTLMASLNFLLTPTIQYYIYRHFKIDFGPIAWVLFILLIVYNAYKVYNISKHLKNKNLTTLIKLPQFL
ncbi:MAG: helix-turn-helix domain-containing protein [Psychroserpens sp.]|uniref:helix-turn-helix domain-containing protein n=1 Tax=Psychroserpens sp. TaxID=2020870 RepID=UPI0030034FF4